MDHSWNTTEKGVRSTVFFAKSAAKLVARAEQGALRFHVCRKAAAGSLFLPQCMYCWGMAV